MKGYPYFNLIIEKERVEKILIIVRKRNYRLFLKYRFIVVREKYTIFAPVLMEGEGCFSDIDIVRYQQVNSLEEVEWEKKSDYSFKETLLGINETLFYFTKDQTIVPKGAEKRASYSSAFL